jgi:hypothetical protein
MFKTKKKQKKANGKAIVGSVIGLAVVSYLVKKVMADPM